MNIYQKLAKARFELQKKEIAKSGENKFANFSYFELSDFLPQINEIFNELGLCGAVSFTKEFATLRIFNAEKPDEMLEFLSPMVEQALKGGTEIQNLGAIQTYQRRYLYMSALEITDNDWVDAQDNTQSNTPKKTQNNTQEKPVNNPETILQAFLQNAEKAQSLEQLKNDFGNAFTLLKPYPQLQQQATDFYQVRKAEFEQG